VLLKSVNVGVLAALFNFGAVARPDGLGIQVRDDIHTNAGHMCGGAAMHLRRFPCILCKQHIARTRLHTYFMSI
jgi:hypothetical protein